MDDDFPEGDVGDALRMLLADGEMQEQAYAQRAAQSGVQQRPEALHQRQQADAEAWGSSGGGGDGHWSSLASLFVDPSGDGDSADPPLWHAWESDYMEVDDTLPPPDGDDGCADAGGAPGTFSQYAARRQHTADVWEEGRRALFTARIIAAAGPPLDAVCSICCSEAVTVQCVDCLGVNGCSGRGCPVDLCGSCDAELHQHVQLHRRQAFTAEYVGAMQLSDRVIVEEGVASVSRGTGEPFFDVQPLQCDTCSTAGHQANWDPAPVRRASLTYVCSSGAHKVCRAMYKCRTCGTLTPQGPNEFISIGLWPTSMQRVDAVVEEEMLEEWLALQARNPTLALSGWLEGLVVKGAAYGLDGQSPWISDQVFRTLAAEYASMRDSMRLTVQRVDDIACPACSPSPHSAHCDGNHKLYTWQRHPNDLTMSSFASRLFDPIDEVDQHIAQLDKAAGGRGGAALADKRCGGVWRAAGDGAGSNKQQGKLVTGRVYAVCRHGFPLGAVNMVRTGERYGYAHKLVLSRLWPRGVRFVHMDIGCKVQPWMDRMHTSISSSLQEGLEDVQASLQQLQQMHPPPDIVLNAVHGMAHSWTCRVLHGAMYRDDSAAGVGEEGEQWFATESGRARNIHNMSVGTSCDVLAQSAMRRSHRKQHTQAAYLARRLHSTETALDAATAARSAALQSNAGLASLAPTAQAQALQGLKAEVEAVAKAESNKMSATADPTVKLRAEFFQATRRAAIAQECAELLSKPARCVLDAGSGAVLTAAPEVPQSVIDAVCNRGRDITQLRATIQEMADSASAELRRCSDLLAALLSHIPASSGLDLGTQEGQERATQLLSEGFVAAAEERIIQLQKVIEGYAADIARKAAKAAHEAEGTKEVSAYNKRIAELGKIVAQHVTEYNSLVPSGSRPRQPADAGAILTSAKASGSTTFQRSQRASEVAASSSNSADMFPWVDEYSTEAYGQLRGVGLKDAVAVVEADLRFQRLTEEVHLLRREMGQHYAYLQQRLDSLGKRRHLLEQHLLMLLTQPAMANAAAASHEITRMAEACHGYGLVEGALGSTQVVRGLIRKHLDAEAMYQQLLKHARQFFSVPVLQQAHQERG